ncbi:LamG-like jellyroll fold domain-containing protein [Micromonospora eburnea]|uniref:Ricin-type beta-trefoil lectin domain-containing protein n=1 Tax=Micromonospora eburnea TaxID=227316 RepID=A0A1C6UA35_9ACTN|nr:LamG-like jellyroll fold domain-containing protein [Micromonospora eburnea]SCL50876.1 Ricin-type beta-trefoil lectin domain-containing protein [Micromonospora eburnea]
MPVSADRRLQRLAAVLVTALTTATFPITIAPARAAQPATPACTTAQPGAAAATATAKACKQRVEVLGRRTESSQTFARPEGGYTTEQYLVPRWAHRPDGSWTDVDTTLTTAANGTITAKAGVLPVTFSPGGSGPAATVRDGAKTLSITWPGGPLPAPTLAGDTATYPEVLPGVDLALTATATGFSEVLVVKSAQAARQPKLVSVSFKLTTDGVTTRAAGGGLEATDEKGRAVFTSPAPQMWDSADQTSHGVRRSARRATMPVRASAGKLTVTPDAAMLTAADTVYPVYIDPSWSGGLRNNNWAIVMSKYPDSAGLSMENASTKGGVGHGRVCDFDSKGNCLSTQYVVRTMFQLDTSGLRGHHVTKASFLIKQLHSWTCNPATTAKLWHIDNAANWENFSGVTWNYTNDWNKFRWYETTTAWASRRTDSAYGCSGPGDDEFDVTGWTRDVAASGGWYLGLGLRADNENDINQWKRFDAGTARLAVDYNDPPTTPDWLQVDGRDCVQGANRPVIPTATPQLSARAWDPDGDPMQLWLAAQKWGGSAFNGPELAGYQDWVANGTRGYWTTPPLDDGGIYAFRAQANDYGRGGIGPVTNLPGNCEFEVDTTDPVAPTVTGDLYTNGCDACGEIGRTGTFTFRSSPDVTHFRWGFGTATNDTWATRPGDPVTVTWTPPEGTTLQQNLVVVAVDRAGRTKDNSAAKYQFTVKLPQPAKAQWPLDDPGTGLTNAQNPGTLDLTVTGGTWQPTGRIPGGTGTLEFNGTSDFATTTGPAVDTAKGFSVAAWVKLSDTTISHTALSQDGVHSTGFKLQYSITCKGWRFVIPRSDSVSPGQVDACGPAAKPNVWTHLAASLDPASATMTLYVNGQKAATAQAPPGFTTSGPFVVGRTRWDDGNYDFWKGGITDVRVWDRVISANEAAVAADGGSPGEWHFGEPGKGPALDSSPYAHDLTFIPNANVPTSGAGQTGTGLQLDGTGYAETDQVLNTDQSFTVSAWVRLHQMPVGNAVIVSQDGSVNSAFHLRYAGIGGGAGKWAFTCVTPDSTSPAILDALSVNTVGSGDLNVWQHLVGVYDATAGQLRLYLNDVLQNTTACTVGASTGSFAIGRSRWMSAVADRLIGDIDEVRVYAGAVPATKILTVDGSRTSQVRLDGTTNCAAIPAGNTTDPRGVIMWGCNGGDEQRFTYDPDRRSLSALGSCVEVKDGVSASGTLIRMATCNGSAAQIWTYDPTTQAFGALGRCLDVPNGKPDPGVSLQLYTCNATNAQRWRLG